MISVQLSRSAFTDGGAVKPLTLNAVRTATVMANALREQAFNDKRKITFSRNSRKFLSDDYMALLGSRFQNKEGWKRAKRLLHILPEGGWIWASSNAWHEIAKKDDASFNRTGGMWRGLKARNYGANAAIIEFAGSSVGQEVVWKRAGKEYKPGKRRLVLKARKITNRLKAYSVFTQKQVNLLQPDPMLQRQFEDGVHDAVLLWFRDATASAPGTLRATSKTGKEFAAALRPQ